MQRYQKKKADASSVASETFSNIKTVKSFSNEQYTKTQYGGLIDESFDIGKAQAIYYATMSTFNQWFFYSGFIGVVAFAGKTV